MTETKTTLHDDIRALTEAFREMSFGAFIFRRAILQFIVASKPVAGPRMIRRHDRLATRRRAHAARRPQLLHNGRKP